MSEQLFSTQVPRDPDFIDLGIGQPEMDMLPRELLREAAEHRLSQADNSILNYGPEAGDGFFRRALGDFLQPHYGFEIPTDTLFLTSGSSRGLSYICNHFTKPGDTIFVEEPTYFLARLVFEDFGLNVVSVAMDEDGIIVEAVEEQLKRFRPKFLYTIPTYHNPTAITLPQERREQLVKLAQEYGFLIVADEVYQLLNYAETPPPPFAAQVGSRHVLSLGSFSKILAPGLRLGWIQTAPDIQKKLASHGEVISGGSLNHFTSNIVRSALELGLQQRYLAELKQHYAQRVELMHSELTAKLHGDVRWHKPTGGFFFWLQLPDGVDAEQLREAGKARKVDWRSGSAFSSDNGLKNYLRLCFAFYDEAAIVEGIGRFADLLNTI